MSHTVILPTPVLYTCKFCKENGPGWEHVMLRNGVDSCCRACKIKYDWCEICASTTVPGETPIHYSGSCVENFDAYEAGVSFPDDEV